MERACTHLIVPGLIDTSLKLRLMLLLYEHPRWLGTAANLSEWLRESPWAVEEAVEALADTGLLGRCNPHGGAIRYRLEPARDQWRFLQQLVSCFADPLARDTIYQQVRTADAERQFRAAAREPGGLAFPLIW